MQSSIHGLLAFPVARTLTITSYSGAWFLVACSLHGFGQPFLTFWNWTVLMIVSNAICPFLLPSGGLSKDEIENMVRDAEAHADADKLKRDRIEASNQVQIDISSKVGRYRSGLPVN